MEKIRIINNKNRLAILILSIFGSILSLPVYADFPPELAIQMRRQQYSSDFAEYQHALARYNADMVRLHQERARLHEEFLRDTAEGKRLAAGWAALADRNRQYAQFGTHGDFETASRQTAIYNANNARYQQDSLILRQEGEPSRAGKKPPWRRIS